MAGLIFMAQPDAKVRTAMLAEAKRVDAVNSLADTMFAPENWHQSLSDRHPDQAQLRESMQLAGASIRASAVTLTLNRIVSGGERAGRIHWAFKACGRPEGFSELTAAIRTALAQQGIRDSIGHTPHITISYFALQKRPSMAVQPVLWTIDELLLVKGGGEPYRYEILDTWALTPVVDPDASQLVLL